LQVERACTSESLLILTNCGDPPLPRFVSSTLSIASRVFEVLKCLSTFGPPIIPVSFGRYLTKFTNQSLSAMQSASVNAIMVPCASFTPKFLPLAGESASIDKGK
jgi:hypothetical protein